MKISIIVPAYNASATLPLCLKAIFEQADSETEVIVVDDCSTDQSGQIAELANANLLRTPARSGPAEARNLGAKKSSGETLFFVDADVVIAPESIHLVRDIFQQNPQISAVFGSYDDAPAEHNFLSQYKNLLHHYVHHESQTRAGTFWAGCGAIRTEVFHAMNGFDSHLYPYPSIEDIELGIRMVERNYEIRLERQLQGKHLKRWTIASLLKADILYRAYPWSKLIANRGVLPRELNLKTYQRISGALTLLLVLLIIGNVFFLSPWIAGASLLLLASLLVLNRDVYRFFYHKKGFLFVIGAFFWHLLYYFYSTITFLYCWIRFRPFARKRILPSSAGTGVHAHHES
jgi:glycosyltransferase involved in cell wall biosynthesis